MRFLREIARASYWKLESTFAFFCWIVLLRCFILFYWKRLDGWKDGRLWRDREEEKRSKLIVSELMMCYTHIFLNVLLWVWHLDAIHIRELRILPVKANSSFVGFAFFCFVWEYIYMYIQLRSRTSKPCQLDWFHGFECMSRNPENVITQRLRNPKKYMYLPLIVKCGKVSSAKRHELDHESSAKSFLAWGEKR